MDVHNTCLVVAILSLTVSAVVIWSSFVRRPDIGAANRRDADIMVILRAIHSDHSQKSSPAGNNSQNSSVPDDDAILRFVSSIHDGRGGHRNLDNYFTGGYFLDRDKYHQQYTHSYLSIMPFFHDASGQFERCLLGTAFAHKHAVPPRMTISNRLKWDTSSQGVFKFKHKFKVHFGEASFGACRSSGGRAHDAAEANQPNSASEESAHASSSGDLRRCGHAFIMQDPIALAIADLAECLQDPGRGPLCQLIHQSKSTVEDWVTARGSVVFNNILFHSDLCQNKTPDVLQQPHLRSNSSSHRSPESACESIHDAFVHNLSLPTVDRLVSLITDNLQNWFSVVGIFEDFVHSLTMLNHVFRFPLHECEFLYTFRDPLSSTTPPDNSRTRRGLLQNSAANSLTPPWSQESQYENMASLPNESDDASDTVSLVHALSHIENNLKWRQKVRTKTAASDPSDSDPTAPGLINNNILDGDNMSGDVKYSLKQAEDNQNTLSLDMDKSLSNLFFEPDKNQNTLFNGPEKNNNTLTNDPDINQNTFFNDPDKNSQIRDTSPSNESNFEDLAGKNGSARSDGSEDDRGEEVDNSNNDIASRQTSMWAAKRRITDTAVARLYKKFAKSLTIRQSLAADMRIYEAVKKLYRAQTRLFFNSVKPT